MVQMMLKVLFGQRSSYLILHINFSNRIIKLMNCLLSFLDNIGKDIVAVRQDNMMITSFHPELTNDLRFHKYFVDMVIAGLNTKKKQTL